MKACSYASKYKGIKPPRCDGGDICDACLEIWQGLAERAVEGVLTDEDRKQIKSTS